MTAKTPSRLTPGQAAREATLTVPAGTDYWDWVTAAAIEASPELKRLREENEQLRTELQTTKPTWYVKNENERLRQRVAEFERASREAEEVMEEARDLMSDAEPGVDEYTVYHALDIARNRLHAVRENKPLCICGALVCAGMQNSRKDATE